MSRPRERDPTHVLAIPMSSPTFSTNLYSRMLRLGGVRHLNDPQLASRECTTEIVNAYFQNCYVFATVSLKYRGEPAE